MPPINSVGIAIAVTNLLDYTHAKNKYKLLVFIRQQFTQSTNNSVGKIHT